jgi:FtsH-binding integral membrane protein
MALIAPPPSPPVVALSDRDGFGRVRFRLRLWGLTALTILVTAWFCTLGALPAILALMVAKHILVAILIVGLENPMRQQFEE